MIYDVQNGVWVYFEYPSNPTREAQKRYYLKKGYYPYNFNFVRGHRGDLAQCSYCGNFFPMKEMTRDHVYPKSRGGVFTTTSCGPCNQAKKNMLPIEYALSSINADVVFNG